MYYSVLRSVRKLYYYAREEEIPHMKVKAILGLKEIKETKKLGEYLQKELNLFDKCIKFELLHRIKTCNFAKFNSEKY